MAEGVARVGIDVGGTFTDLVALDAEGGLRLAKVPSTPDDPARGNWAALDAAGVSPAAMLHGTTVATNALLERSGARTVLLATAGFEDLLWLRRQDRAGLYDLVAQHPAPLPARDDVIGVTERIGPRGVIVPLTNHEITRVVEEVCHRAPEAVAVALLFSFRDPSHEIRLAGAVREALPAIPVVTSAELLPVFREYERTGTTVAEAFLRPGVGSYVDRLGREAARRRIAELRVMASSGGTLGPELAGTRATSLALSGPVGGVEGARLVGAAAGEVDLLTLDMGGTSADASVILDGKPLERLGADVGGVPLALPHVLIETVGAGGGSIAWVDAGGALRVGPQSAGAVPGPACYGQGGTDATVTDAVLVLGWLDEAHPLASNLRLDAGAARTAVGRVAAAAGLAVERCAEGIVDVAVATMVRALRRVSVERGLDPRRMTLVPFGGAGPLFTCRLAGSLGMTRALVPPHPGVLSALGLATAPAKVEAVASWHREIAWAEERGEWEAVFGRLEREVREALPGAELQRVAECRYRGQGYELPVDAGAGAAATGDRFHALHRERYGHADRQRPVEVVNVRVSGIRMPPSSASRTGGWMAQGLGGMRVGESAAGPVTIPLADATIRVEPGWEATVHESGALLVHRVSRAPERPAA